jgi:hypothetical protein
MYGDMRHIFKDDQDLFSQNRQYAISFAKNTLKSLEIYFFGNAFRQEVSGCAIQMRAGTSLVDQIKTNGVLWFPTHSLKTCPFIADMKRAKKGKRRGNPEKGCIGQRKLAGRAVRLLG